MLYQRDFGDRSSQRQLGYGLGLASAKSTKTAGLTRLYAMTFTKTTTCTLNSGDGACSHVLQREIGHTSPSTMGVDIADIEIYSAVYTRGSKQYPVCARVLRAAQHAGRSSSPRIPFTLDEAEAGSALLHMHLARARPILITAAGTPRLGSRSSIYSPPPFFSTSLLIHDIHAASQEDFRLEGKR